jgi:hypothetical protein
MQVKLNAEQGLKVLSAEVLRYDSRNRHSWEVAFTTNHGLRMSRNTWNCKGAAQAYADAVVSGYRKPEFFYL